jgi:hypothetical protein
MEIFDFIREVDNYPNICITYYRCFLYRQDIGWSRLCASVLMWSCELQRTTMHTIVYPGLGPCYEVIVLRPTFFY